MCCMIYVPADCRLGLGHCNYYPASKMHRLKRLVQEDALPSRRTLELRFKKNTLLQTLLELVSRIAK